jgi:Flp pilus assembly protein TadG
MSLSSDAPASRQAGDARVRTARSVLRDRRGQALVEFALLVPVLLLLLCGVIEIGRMLETNHIMSALTREGANLASRGATMQEALNILRTNQQASGLGNVGGAVVSRLLVDQNGIPVVEAQISTLGYENASMVAPQDSVADAYTSAGLTSGYRYYVVELFIPYTPITPLSNFMAGFIPESLYDRSLF